MSVSIRGFMDEIMSRKKCTAKLNHLALVMHVLVRTSGTHDSVARCAPIYTCLLDKDWDPHKESDEIPQGI